MILRVYNKRKSAYIGRRQYWQGDRFVGADKARIFSSLGGIRLSATNGCPSHNPFDWDWFRVEELTDIGWKEIKPGSRKESHE